MRGWQYWSYSQNPEEEEALERGQVERLTKGRQIVGPEREKIATRLRDAYTQGASIRGLMEQTGRSYGWTHRLLRESGAQLRGRGGAHPTRKAATIRKS